MHPMLTIAVRAARKAGNLIAKHYETPDSVETSQKGSNDFVTNVDKAAEAIIIETIRKSYPQHTIITEESGEHEGKIRMFNGLSIHWMAPPTSSNVCHTSLCLSPYALKAVLKSPWFTIQCVTNCSPRPAVRAHS
jgi:3'-phosphoadenosine 5'-phosphosulfate (PAPS) 3'-phosphatase